MNDAEPVPPPQYGYPHNGPVGPGPGPAPGPPGPPGPPPGYDYPPPSGPPPRRERHRDGTGTRRLALVIQSLADVAAVFLGLWILLYLLDANGGNPFVGFVQGVADWLGWWARDMFTMDLEGLRVLLNYGLPAVIYLLVGHGVAAWLRRATEE